MADAFEGDDGLAPLILTKKKKIPAEGHGGAWKIAYADFVTAMMAFFLLLWLLNATTENQMNGLSEYFAPANIAENAAAVGEAMAGMAVAVEGAMRSASSRPKINVALPSYGKEAEGDFEGDEREDEDLSETEQAAAIQEEQRNERLNEAMEQLRQSVMEQELLREIQTSMMFEITNEGLRIQILDQEDRPLFEENTDELTRYSRQLLAVVGSIMSSLPNEVEITVHTERNGFIRDDDYTNWELSTDRAFVIREWLVNAGLPDSKIVTVRGKGASDLLDPRYPGSIRNRRLAILLTFPDYDSAISAQVPTLE
ncbi:flagellar motor protein MotB [Curvivirga sp.]|uniref:flagellar motor protein MotB n=1 Tax=Curvivirga sp. TaxID=2856848 RepID=UPI003B5A0058